MTTAVMNNPKDREEKAIIYHKAVLENAQSITVCWRVLIRASKEIRDKHLYIELGYESFAQYLAQPEISVKSDTMAKYISVYEATVMEGKITDAEFQTVPISKMELIARLENPHKWIDDARELSYTGLREKILKDVHGIESDDVSKYSRKIDAGLSGCPHWNEKKRKCLAGIDVKERCEKKTKPVDI